MILTREKEFSSSLLPDARTAAWTPLHYAALFGNVDVVKVLIQHMADPNKRVCVPMVRTVVVYRSAVWYDMIS